MGNVFNFVKYVCVEFMIYIMILLLVKNRWKFLFECCDFVFLFFFSLMCLRENSLFLMLRVEIFEVRLVLMWDKYYDN